MRHDDLLSMHDDASLDGRDEAFDILREGLAAAGSAKGGPTRAREAAACIAAMLLVDGEALLLAAREGQPWIRGPVTALFGELRTPFPESAPAFHRIRLRQPVERAHFSIRELAGTPAGRARLATLIESIWDELRARLDTPQSSGLLWALVALRTLRGLPKVEVDDALSQLAEADLEMTERRAFRRALEALAEP